jgi:hypothetical protein
LGAIHADKLTATPPRRQAQELNFIGAIWPAQNRAAGLISQAGWRGLVWLVKPSSLTWL